MKCISAVTIGKLIEAHMEHDEEKFMVYANFIADAYEESGEERSAKIIRNKISGEYKKRANVAVNTDSLIKLLKYYCFQRESLRIRPYTVHDGKEYHGTVYIDGAGGVTDGHGHKVEYR